MNKWIIPFLFALFVPLTVTAHPLDNPLQYQSAFMRVELAPDQPALVSLAVDSLGKNKLSVNALRPPAQAATTYEMRRVGAAFEYRRPGASPGTLPVWTFDFSAAPNSLALTFCRRESASAVGAELQFLESTMPRCWDSSTMTAACRLPALLHLPDQGTFRITSSPAKGLALGYDALRHAENPSPSKPTSQQAGDYVKVTFPAASAGMPDIDYNLEVVAIYPGPPELARDSRFDGFRRNWLNIFQLNPRLRVLANHASSDPCAFTLYEYSSMAVRTPPLAPGLTALDMIRLTLDRYLSGMKAYGMAGYQPDVPYDFLDSYPSLLIAASDYVQASKDNAWLKNNYPRLKRLGREDARHGSRWEGADGIPLEWQFRTRGHREVPVRPANWWDDIGFGHQDAYSNALAYHALLGMAELARQGGQPADAHFILSRAEKLRSVLFRHLLQPRNGGAGGLEERRWKPSRLLLHFRQQCRHRLWPGSSRQGQRHHGSPARQNESGGLCQISAMACRVP